LKDRILWAVVDASYCNRTVFKGRRKNNFTFSG
jgi:hypothetical protein